MPEKHQFSVTRKYSRVLFLSIITLGLYYFIYQWWLFRGLEDHYQEAFESEKESFPTRNNPITMFVLQFLIPFYVIYVKYRILHEHISTSSIETESNCAEGYRAVILFILLGIPSFWIVPLVLEANWQKAYNRHLLAHERKKSE